MRVMSTARVICFLSAETSHARGCDSLHIHGHHIKAVPRWTISAFRLVVVQGDCLLVVLYVRVQHGVTQVNHN